MSYNLVENEAYVDRKLNNNQEHQVYSHLYPGLTDLVYGDYNEQTHAKMRLGIDTTTWRTE